MTNNYGFSDTAVTVLKERYMHVKPDGSQETIPEMFSRVANYLSKEKAQEYYQVMMSRDFIPNSPTLMNAGRAGMAAQLSACYVLPVEDSMDGIFTSLHHQAMIHKYGGGTGFNFSKLRPKGSRVNTTNGVASGPVSFMELFDVSTEKVMQGGCFPAGTLVATLNGAMPIEKLTAGTLVYSYDLQKGFVLNPCTDSFMTRENQPIWELKTDKGFSVKATKDHPFIIRPYSNRKDLKKSRLNTLLPGTGLLTFKMNTVKRAKTAHSQKVLSVADTGLTADVWNVEVPGTHNFVVCDEEMTCGLVVKNTRRGANMGILNVDHPDILEFISCKASDTKRLNNFNISVGMNDEFMSKVENKALNEQEREIWNAIIDCAWKNGDPGLVFFDEINRHNTTPELGELTATNPCLRGNMKILTDKGYIAIEELVGKKVTVWNGFEWSEVEPRITGHNQPMLRITFSNGSVIDCTPYHKFYINDNSYNENTIVKMAAELEIDDYIAEYWTPFVAPNALDVGLHFDVRVVSITPCEEADTVYCVTEPKRHSMIVEGVMTGNCGETPLLPFEACNLGSINLSHFITYTGQGEYFNGRGIDWQGLEQVTRIAVEMLNDVIDVNCYPIPEVTEAVHLTRKIGLGVMGWADMLCKLGIKYGGPESLKLAEEVMSFIQRIGHDQSNGRNACVTCIAPTGSISLIADCSSGIEPYFALEYDRIAFDKENRTILHYVNEDYEEAIINHDERLDNGVFVTAHEINFFEHIDMQAAFQKYTDLAVSKTINLPNEATKQDVERAYLYAWIKNCKGITVYRNGSRDTQVLIAGEECPECGAKAVIYESGCKKCTQCGWSPCSV